MNGSFDFYLKWTSFSAIHVYKYIYISICCGIQWFVLRVSALADQMGKADYFKQNDIQYGIYLFWWNLMVRKHIRWKRVVSDKKNTTFIRVYCILVVICYFFFVQFAWHNFIGQTTNKQTKHKVILSILVRIKIDVHFPTWDPISPKKMVGLIHLCVFKNYISSDTNRSIWLKIHCSTWREAIHFDHHLNGPAFDNRHVNF